MNNQQLQVIRGEFVRALAESFQDRYGGSLTITPGDDESEIAFLWRGRLMLATVSDATPDLPDGR